MRVRIILPVAVLALMACDTSTEPHSFSPGDVPRTAEVDGSSGYTATLLPEGDFTGNYPYGNPMAINDRGEIFASLRTNTTDPNRAVRWEVEASGNVTGPVLLGALPSPFDANQTVHAANGSGVAVGYSHDSERDLTAGWVWADGLMTMLLPLPDDEHPRVYPGGISAEGVVVGQVRTVSGDGWQAYAAVWFPPYEAAPLLLPVMEGYVLNSAEGITSAGVVSGWVRGYEVPDAYVEWRVEPDGSVTSGPIRLDGSDDRLMSSVNPDRDIAGAYHGGALTLTGGTNQSEASLYRSDLALWIDLGRFDGHTRSGARSLTARDQDGTLLLAGYSYSEWSDDADDRTAAIWTVYADGSVAGPIDPGPPPAYPNNSPSNRFETARALSINGAGWAVGESRRADGRMFATLWQPAQTSDDDPPPSGDAPVASFDYGCDNSSTCRFTDTSTPGANEIASWLWSSGDGQSADTQHTSFTFSAEGSYTVSLTVTDANELSDQASATVSCSMHRKHGLRCS